MTAPGVYSPAQLMDQVVKHREELEAHARRVARDEDDTEAREVEAMAKAIRRARRSDISEPHLMAILDAMPSNEDDMRAATAARNALLAMREGE